MKISLPRSTTVVAHTDDLRVALCAWHLLGTEVTSSFLVALRLRSTPRIKAAAAQGLQTHQTWGDRRTPPR